MERVGRKGGWVWFREMLEAKTRRILGSGDILEEEIGPHTPKEEREEKEERKKERKKKKKKKRKRKR